MILSRIDEDFKVRYSRFSNADRVQNISHSIYVMNFPDSATSRDLWNACSVYGTVVDVFIPLKKSKVRFNKEAKHWPDGCPIGNGRLGGFEYAQELSMAIYFSKCKGFLTEKEYQQLLQDEEVLRQTLEEEARAEKEWEEKMKKEQAEYELFRLEIKLLFLLPMFVLIPLHPEVVADTLSHNKTAKDLWDALTRHMLGSEYGEQDRKAAVLFPSKSKSLLEELLWIFAQEKMSRDVLTVGSTMRIPLLYQGEYSQWVKMFMNYLEEKTDGEAMINCIKNGDQTLPRVTQVSIAGNSSTEQPHLKDKSMWSDQEKKIQKIDRLSRSLLIQGLSNDIYSLIDSNKTVKDLYVNDAMGLKKKTVVVTSDPLALIAEKTKVSKSKEKFVVSSNSEGSDADDFSESKKITALLAKDFNPKKFYSKPTNNNLRTSSTSQSANKKQEFVKTNDKKFEKKDDEKKRDMRKVKCYNCKKEGHFAKDCKKFKVKDYEYYKTKMLLAKKDKDEQVLLAEDQAWMESSSDSDQEINANMVFMDQIEKVLSDSDTSSSSADDKISEVSYYLSESKSESEYETLEYYDNTTTYCLFVNDNDDQKNFHVTENFPESLIKSQIDHNESVVNHNDSEGIYKLIRKFNKKIAKCLKRIEKANQQNKDFENQNKDLQVKNDVLKNQATTFEMNNKELNEQLKVFIKKNDNLLAQTNVLKD
uniref:DUF4219 domain-containing protein/UBN2 domain-containing protein n=1 Tax=Tanacetum cinerariifolium TaxID=118510 RepID=A0A6L2M531_TANCI|nr:DUF4219 domain-containing protein/UBN2 domain-containing protein [Tanacetum cinerariifolium]